MAGKALAWMPVLGMAALILGACSQEKVEVPDCPAVHVLDDAGRITVYRQGQGRDLTDIVYQAELTGFTGDCRYIGKRGDFSEVALSMRVKFNVMPGPAMTGPTTTLNYFVRIPDFYPQPEGSAEFSRPITLPANGAAVEVVDSAIDIRIPLGEQRRGPDTAVYLGFVLTPEQLERNRRRPVGRLTP